MFLAYLRIGICSWLAAVALSAFGQCSSPKGKQVADFSATGLSRVAAVLKLGEQERVCFGIAYTDTQSLLEPISVSLSNTSIQQILRKIFAGETGYEFVEEDTAVLIARTLPPGQPNFFARSISRFVVPRATVQQISNALWMQVQVEVNPEIRGFAGHFPTGDLKDVIDGFDEQNVSLLQVLLSIIERSKGALWITTMNPTHVEKLPTECPWRILEYGQNWQGTAILSAIASSLQTNNSNSR